MPATPSFLDFRGGPLRPGRPSPSTHCDDLGLTAADWSWRPTAMLGQTVRAGIGVGMLAIHSSTTASGAR
jgi:hypothetical protein